MDFPHATPAIRLRPASARAGCQASGQEQGRQKIARIPDAADFLRRRATPLAALTGPVAPQSWRGGLPITYHVGPGPARSPQTRHLTGSYQTGL